MNAFATRLAAWRYARRYGLPRTARRAGTPATGVYWMLTAMEPGQ